MKEGLSPLRKNKQGNKLIIILQWLGGFVLGLAIISTIWACFVYRDRNGSFLPKLNAATASNLSSSSDMHLPASTPIPDGNKLQLDPNATSKTPDPQKSETEPIKNVSIAGFKTLHIAADTLNVSVDFFNPESNKENFFTAFELLLPTADGSYESVYSSGLVEAGNHITSITLSHPIARGTYENCIFRVQPYFVSDRSPANMAEAVFTLYAE